MDILFKLFESEKLDLQILFFKDLDDAGKPAIILMFDYEEAGAVIRLTFGYSDSDEGYEKRDLFFASITKEDAEERVTSILNSFK